MMTMMKSFPFRQVLTRALFQSTRFCSTEANWRVWSALDSRDEAQKVRLAGLLHELTAVARESRDSGHCSGTPTTMLARRMVSPSFDPREIRLPANLRTLTPGVAADALDMLLRGRRIESASLSRLLSEGAAALRAEPSVVDLRHATEVTVVGDLHGCLPSLRSVLHLARGGGGGGSGGSGGSSAVGRAIFSFDSLSPIVFNGDFVDRGAKGVEVLAALLLLRLSHPNGG